MKVIFLDFDGVMTSVLYNNKLACLGFPEYDEYGVLFAPDCVSNLRRIVEETGAEIVVTSDWKHRMSYKEMLAMWKKRGLPGFVTDMVPICYRHRGDEIDRWLKDSKLCCPYVIIDGLPMTNFNNHQIPHLFRVDKFIGLDETIADKVVEHLNNATLSEYSFILRRYPARVVDSIDPKHLLRFFRNEAADTENRKHDEILAVSEEQLEEVHDYIQWIFPTVTKSDYNNSAPVVTSEFQALFAMDKLAQCNYCKSCRKFLRYIGFDCANGVIEPIDTSNKFYTLPWHNLLRITRVLESLRVTGHKDCSARLFDLLIKEVENNPDARVETITLDYWKRTQLV